MPAFVRGRKPARVITHSVTTRSTFYCLSDVEIDVFFGVLGAGSSFSQTPAILNIYLCSLATCYETLWKACRLWGSPCPKGSKYQSHISIIHFWCFGWWHSQVGSGMGFWRLQGAVGLRLWVHYRQAPAVGKEGLNSGRGCLWAECGGVASLFGILTEGWEPLLLEHIVGFDEHIIVWASTLSIVVAM